jgi:molybdopterin-guanine dinucleotide biosynthesis protein A
VITDPPIVGVILAGGRGSRMGERDKGWIELRGRPLIAHVVERFAPQVDRLIVSANRSLERYAGLGVKVVTDLRPDYPGPLAGLEAALDATDARILAAVPCDSPFLPLDLVARLRQRLRADAAQIAVPRVGGRIHPVFCVCTGDVRDSIERALTTGQHRLERWCRSLKLAEVDFEDAGAFRNLNAPDDLEQ